MFKPEDVPILRGKSEHSLKHSTNNLYAIDIYLQRKKIVFSNGILLGILSTPG